MYKQHERDEPMYKIITLDLDGTLTNSKKEITPATKAALINIQKRGYKVILASGRPTHGVMPLARELELDKYGSYILSFNGGKIINCSSMDTIYQKTLPEEVIPELYEYAMEYNVGLITYDNDDIITGTPVNKYMKYESEIVGMPIKTVDDFPKYVDFPVTKCLMSGEPDKLTPVEDALKEHYHQYLNIFRSEPFFLEIMPKGIDKAHSLLKLLSSIGISEKEMICCGDGYNDLSMIKLAGLGVAMSNAQEIVKESADYVTLSNDEDGIVHVINKFML